MQSVKKKWMKLDWKSGVTKKSEAKSIEEVRLQ